MMRSCCGRAVEEGRVEPGIDRVLRLAVAVCCGGAGEPRGAVEVVADCGDCGEAGHALAGGEQDNELATECELRVEPVARSLRVAAEQRSRARRCGRRVPTSGRSLVGPTSADRGLSPRPERPYPGTRARRCRPFCPNPRRRHDMKALKLACALVGAALLLPAGAHAATLTNAGGTLTYTGGAAPRAPWASPKSPLRRHGRRVPRAREPRRAARRRSDRHPAAGHLHVGGDHGGVHPVPVHRRHDGRGQHRRRPRPDRCGRCVRRGHAARLDRSRRRPR